MRILDLFKTLFLSLLFSVFASIAQGQIDTNLTCDSHSVSDMVMGFDTTAGSIGFYIVDSLNNPINDLQLIIQVPSIKLEKDKILAESYEIKMKSDFNGFTHTGLVHLLEPEIIIMKNGKTVYQFEFTKRLDGYGYTVYVKLCD
ncbi:MAG: hypothetical protein ACPGVD_11080 [Flavobacteriales bacterium]